jgi:hypothetical protein
MRRINEHSAPAWLSVLWQPGGSLVSAWPAHHYLVHLVRQCLAGTHIIPLVHFVQQCLAGTSLGSCISCDCAWPAEHLVHLVQQRLAGKSSRASRTAVLGLHSIWCVSCDSAWLAQHLVRLVRQCLADRSAYSTRDCGTVAMLYTVYMACVLYSLKPYRWCRHVLLVMTSLVYNGRGRGSTLTSSGIAQHTGPPYKNLNNKSCHVVMWHCRSERASKRCRRWLVEACVPAW